MDIRKELLKEHSKSQCTKIVNYIGNNAIRFNELIDLFLTDDYLINQRAAWPLSYCSVNNPTLVKPHLKKLIVNLQKPTLHNAVARNTFRFLQEIEIPKALQGITLELCFKYLTNRESPIAVKVFAMTVASNICRWHPSLKQELKLIIEDQLPFGSVGFISRAKKILKRLAN